MTDAVDVDPAPFDLGDETAPAAALCLHGLTGTPYEVRPIAESLARAGVRAKGPALPGHNTTPEELAALPYTSWLDAARGEIAELRGAHEQVFVVGLSMGGLVSLALAAEGLVDAIVVVGTPVRFSAPIPQLMPLLKYLRPFLAKKEGSDIRDHAARRRHPGYGVMPLAAVHQLIHLQRVVRAGLSSIQVPTFVAHGAQDRTAAPRDAVFIHESIEGSELMLLDNSGHVVPVDVDGAALAEAICEFLLDPV